MIGIVWLSICLLAETWAWWQHLSLSWLVIHDLGVRRLMPWLKRVLHLGLGVERLRLLSELDHIWLNANLIWSLLNGSKSTVVHVLRCISWDTGSVKTSCSWNIVVVNLLHWCKFCGSLKGGLLVHLIHLSVFDIFCHYLLRSNKIILLPSQYFDVNWGLDVLFNEF